MGNQQICLCGCCKSAGNNYYRANTAGKTGSLRPSHTEGMSWDGWGGSGDEDTGVQWEYLQSGFGIAELIRLPEMDFQQLLM